MKQRNRIKSISLIGWGALFRLRNHGKCEQYDERSPTLDALERRGLLVRVDIDDFHSYAISEHGRDVVDARESR